MIKVIVYIAVIIAFIVGYAKYIESRAIFFPVKNVEFTPGLLNISFEDVYISTEDNIQIHGWFIPSNSARYTMLFCHGNAGNIGYRLEKLALLRKINMNIFIFDYRGYGKSAGRPSEAGLYLDTRCAYDYLVNTRKIKPEDIILYGESLGNAAIIHLASEQKVGGLIAEGAFTRGRDMAKRIYPFLPAFLFSDGFDSLARIGQVKAPKLFLHSRDDEVVPLALAKKLYNAAPAPKRFVELSGGHNETCTDSEEKYVSSITAFISQQAAKKE